MQLDQRKFAEILNGVDDTQLIFTGQDAIYDVIQTTLCAINPKRFIPKCELELNISEGVRVITLAADAVLRVHSAALLIG